MPIRVILPAHVHGMAFRASDADFHGTTRSRLRGADVAHPFHGVCSVDLDTSTMLGRCLAYEPRLGPGHVFSHATSAALFGMPLPMDTDARLHVSETGAGAAPRTRGVIGHALTAGDVAKTIHRGVPVVSAADTWCQLAAILPREDLVAAGDFLISGRRMRSGREAPLCTREELASAVEKSSGRRGSRALHWALPRLRMGVDSRPESLLRLLLVAAKLPEPLVNDPTLVDDGRRTLHPDLKYERWRVAFEYEGDGHRTDKRRFRRDIVRRELFEAAGWRVIRVIADDLADPQAFIARVRRILRDREAFLAVLEARDVTK